MATAMLKLCSLLKCGSVFGNGVAEEVLRKSYRILTAAVHKNQSLFSFKYVKELSTCFVLLLGVTECRGS
jgi:hypothetical protein